MDAAQHRLDAGQKLARVEGLAEIIVGAELQTDDSVGLLGHGGEKDDGNFGRVAQMAAERQAVLARHHDVEHDEIEGAAVEQPAQRLGAFGNGDAIALPGEIFPHQVAYVAVIVDDRNMRRRIHAW